MAAMLRTVSFLARASDDGLARLAAQSVLRKFERGSFLFRTGEPAERIYVIQHGRVAATVSSRDGAKLTFHIAEAGECAGFSALLDPQGHQASAHALTHVEAVVIPAAACLELISAEPWVGLDYARELTSVIRILNESMADLVFLDLERRLARTLVEAPSRDDMVWLPVSQGELAARLGSARQSLNQALARLAHRGFVRIEAPQRIRITDRAALVAFVADQESSRAHGGSLGPAAVLWLSRR